MADPRGGVARDVGRQKFLNEAGAHSGYAGQCSRDSSVNYGRNWGTSGVEIGPTISKLCTLRVQPMSKSERGAPISEPRARATHRCRLRAPLPRAQHRAPPPPSPPGRPQGLPPLGRFRGIHDSPPPLGHSARGVPAPIGSGAAAGRAIGGEGSPSGVSSEQRRGASTRR